MLETNPSWGRFEGVYLRQQAPQALSFAARRMSWSGTNGVFEGKGPVTKSSWGYRWMLTLCRVTGASGICQGNRNRIVCLPKPFKLFYVYLVRLVLFHSYELKLNCREFV